MQHDSKLMNLSGRLLVAHPNLLDPNFRRRVVLIASHSQEDGALGVIINWSLDQTLADYDSAFAFEPLGVAPLYRGGPVAADEIMFAAWNWVEEEGLFRLGFGIGADQARGLVGESHCEVRAFLGYAGWGKGQLEEEMAHHSWMVSSVDEKLIGGPRGTQLWKEIVSSVSPEMRLFADAPEDPSVN